MNKQDELEFLKALESDSKYTGFIFCIEETETTVSIMNDLMAETTAIEYGLEYELINDKKHFKSKEIADLFINIVTLKVITKENYKQLK
jgi:hypothetical protein